MTGAQMRALRWLYNRDGEGIFDRNGVLMAKGELAGVMRSTWNALADAKMVIFSANRNGRRVAITATGKAEAEKWDGREAGTVEG